MSWIYGFAAGCTRWGVQPFDPVGNYGRLWQDARTTLFGFHLGFLFLFYRFWTVLQVELPSSRRGHPCKDAGVHQHYVRTRVAVGLTLTPAERIFHRLTFFPGSLFELKFPALTILLINCMKPPWVFTTEAGFFIILDAVARGIYCNQSIILKPGLLVCLICPLPITCKWSRWRTYDANSVPVTISWVASITVRI